MSMIIHLRAEAAALFFFSPDTEATLFFFNPDTEATLFFFSPDTEATLFFFNPDTEATLFFFSPDNEAKVLSCFRSADLLQLLVEYTGSVHDFLSNLFVSLFNVDLLDANPLMQLFRSRP